MPYKSDAQRRLFHHLAAQGKIPMSKVREYDAASKGKKLPEFVGHAKKAFGGQIEGKKGVRCPACDYPLDQIPVALDAGEACPRCGYGSAKDVPHKARGGEMMDVTAYRARGGAIRQYAEGGSVDKASTWTSAKQEARDKEYFEKFWALQNRFGRESDAAARLREARLAQEVSKLVKQYPEQPGKEQRDSELRRIKKDLATRGAVEGEMGPPTPLDRPLTTYQARGGEICSKCGHDHKMARGGDVMHCARCGSMMAMGGYVPLKARGGDVGLEGNMKELYPSKRECGADLDDGKIRRFGKTFADAIKYRRR
jgi:DNA-directed RNA polymerase subunit RPC12/RpoP